MQKLRTLTLILTLSALTTFTSCDCLQNVTGTVVDAQTNQPIQDAHVQKMNKNNVQADTDENGGFELSCISGGLFGCPPMTVVVSMDGYETQTVKIDNAGHTTIKLQPKSD